MSRRSGARRQISSGAETTYDVRVWKVLVEERPRRRRSYAVRWTVAGKRRRDTFATRALAESFRAELLTAVRHGSPFDVATGRPVIPGRMGDTSWYSLMCDYVDMKWAEASPNSRRSIADALAAMTGGLLATERGRPSPKALRAAVYKWVAQPRRRRAGESPEELAAAVAWLENNTVRTGELADRAVLRRALAALSRSLTGRPVAPATVTRRRATLHNVIEYGVIERRVIDANVLPEVSWRAPRTAEAIDRRRVVNPRQAEALLAAVEKDAPHLVAFFGCMYYSGLRPAEVVELTEDETELPARRDDDAWGWFHLGDSAPSSGSDWNESGTRRQTAVLKHRSADEVRRVPMPPALVRLIQDHLARGGTGPGGHLFSGRRGGRLSDTEYSRIWKKAREQALSQAEQRSPLAKRPYDLRHACLSTWLNAGVEPARVAEWAGNGVPVLLRTYAKCISGQEDAAIRRIQNALTRANNEGRDKRE